MKEIENIASDLFDKIRNRFPNLSLGDSRAKATSDPEKARFFNFTYTDGLSDADVEAGLGKITLSLIDETSLKIYFGKDIVNNLDKEQRRNWYAFIRDLRQFTKRKGLESFDVRDINKNGLDLRDIKQQSASDDVVTKNDVNVTESRLYGSAHRSYSDQGKTRLLIKHSTPVNDEVHGARTRYIKEIFVETELGERFLMPFKNLHGARAMAQHISNGGNVQDERGQHICELVNEMSAMRHFVRATKDRQFEDQETADMTRAAVQHYNQIKKQLRHMRGERGYRDYFENWVAPTPLEQEIDVAALRERFVKKVYDDRFDEALPIVYREHLKQKNTADSLTQELDEWLTSVLEDADGDSEIDALNSIMKAPIHVGIDGMDALSNIKQIIPEIERDDDLEAAIYQLSQGQGPDADARTIIKVWLKDNLPELYNRIQIGQNNVDDASTNYAPQVSPQADNHAYGDTGMDWPRENPTIKENDELDFIRSLAGLRK